MLLNVDGYPEPYPADVICCFHVNVPEPDSPRSPLDNLEALNDPLGDTASNEREAHAPEPSASTSDYVFVQFYDDVFRDHKSHPHVPACRFVSLHDSYGLVTVEQLLRPVFLVPNVDFASAREPACSRRTPRDKRARPTFFVLSEFM